MKRMTTLFSIILMLFSINLLYADIPAAATSFAAGDGTVNNPYQISNFSELLYFSQSASGLFNYYELTANIDASASKDVEGGYPQIALFLGHLNGNDYAIDSLYLEHSFIAVMNLEGYKSAIGTDALDIINLGFTNLEIKGQDASNDVNNLIGGIVGSIEAGGLIENCYVTGNIEGRQSVGGIAARARANAKIIDSYVRADVTKPNSVISLGNLAGIIANVAGPCSVTNCFYSGKTRWPIARPNDNVEVTNCYYDLTGVYYEAELAVASGLTLTEIAQETSFNNWNFPSIWIISSDGYPELRKYNYEWSDRVYYVSPEGDDNNSGTINAPFKTIYKALLEMTEGNTCYLREGVYRERLHIVYDQIAIKAYPGENVTISGSEVIDNWEHISANSYKAFVPKKVYQFFENGERAHIATYPDIDADYHIMDKWASTVTDDNGSPFVTFTGDSFEENSWDGAQYIGCNSGTSNNDRNPFKAARGKVISNSGNSLFMSSSNIKPKGSGVSTGGVGFGFLLFHKQALTSAKEWFYENDTLYYITDGTPISEIVCEARTLDYVIEMDGVSHISLVGLNIKGGSILMKDATNCLIDSCSVRYISPFVPYDENDWGTYENCTRGVYVSGSNNTIRNSYFGSSWTSCVTLDGVNQTISNCLIENANWAGSRLALLSVHGDSCTITRNTLRHATRDGIEAGNGAWIGKVGLALNITNNLIYSTNTRHTDGGIFYSNHQRANINWIANTTLSHNWFKVNSDKYNVSNMRYTGAFYPDNYSSGYTAKYNVILDTYSAIKSNAFDEASSQNTFFNNTLKGVSVAGVGTGYETFEEISNNFSNEGFYPGTPEYSYVPIILRNNVNYSSAGNEFIVGDYWDFRIKSTSSAIDAAAVIDGVTSTSTPDAGCYEYGEPAWIAGCDFDIPVFADEASYTKPLDVPILNSVVYDSSIKSVRIDWDDNSTTTQAVAIERKEGTEDWVRVGTVLAGIESYIDSYSVQSEMAIYRVRNVENDDISAVSASISVQIPSSLVTNKKYDDSASSITVYPNPTKNNFTINTTEEVSVSVVDISGKIMVAPIVVNGKKTISVSQLDRGVYFVKTNIETITLIIE